MLIAVNCNVCNIFSVDVHGRLEEWKQISSTCDILHKLLFYGVVYWMVDSI